MVVVLIVRKYVIIENVEIDGVVKVLKVRTVKKESGRDFVVVHQRPMRGVEIIRR